MYKETYMNKMHKIALVIAITAIMVIRTTAARAEETIALSLNEFCEQVVAYYPHLQEQAVSVEMAIAQKLEAAAGGQLRVRAEASVVQSDDQVFVFGAKMRQRSFTQNDFDVSRLNNPTNRLNNNAGIYAELPLFDALETSYRVRSADALIGAARMDERFAKTEAILLAADTYVRAASIDKAIGIIDDVCSASDTDLKQADALKGQGMILGADYFVAKVIMGEMRSLRNELGERKKILMALMNILTGQDPARPIRLLTDPADVDVNAGSLSELIAQAEGSRPDFKAIDEALRAQRDDLTRAKAGWLPRVSAFGDLQGNTKDFHKSGQSYAIGLKGTVDIFDPGYSSRVKTAAAAVRKLEARRRMARDLVRSELSRECGMYESLRLNLPLVREMIADAKEAVGLMLPLYREGRKSVVDLFEIRRAYLKAAQQYYEIVADKNASRARLLFLSGSLESTGVEALLTGGK